MHLCLRWFVSEKSVCVCVWVECPGVQKGHLPDCGLGSTSLGAFVVMTLHESSSTIVATPCIWSTFPRHCVNQPSTAGDVSRHEHRLRAQKVSSLVSYEQTIHGPSCTDVFFFLTGFDWLLWALDLSVLCPELSSFCVQLFLLLTVEWSNYCVRTQCFPSPVKAYLQPGLFSASCWCILLIRRCIKATDSWGE